MQSFLTRLPESLQQKLLKAGRLITYAKDETIFEEKAPPQFFPILLSGRLKIVKYLVNGKETIINIFAANDVLLIPPLIDNKPFPATGIALEHTEILKIDREHFLKFLHDEPNFSMAIISELCGLLREKNTVIKELATQSPEHRVIVNLLRISKKLEISPGKPLVIPLKRRDMADMSGLTTETTIRVIRQLAQKQLLRIEKGKILIDDLAGLQMRLKEI